MGRDLGRPARVGRRRRSGRGAAGRAATRLVGSPIASVTKPLVAYAVLVAVEEGALELDDPAGPPGATVRHLLAHTAGYGFDSGAEVLAPPGTRRIYSNRGYEVLGAHLESQTGIPLGVYLAEAVLEPLGMTGTTLDGSPAFGGAQHGRRPGPVRGRVAVPDAAVGVDSRRAASGAVPGPVRGSARGRPVRPLGLGAWVSSATSAGPVTGLARRVSAADLRSLRGRGHVRVGRPRPAARPASA